MPPRSKPGLGGRLDATNVLDAPVVLLTNVGLEHTDVLGDTREAIAREKLAVASPGAIVVLGEPEWAYLVPDNDVRTGGAQEAAEAFLGRSIDARSRRPAPRPPRVARGGRALGRRAHAGRGRLVAGTVA